MSRKYFQVQNLLLILSFLVLPVAIQSSPEAIETVLRRLDSKRAPASAQQSAAKGVLSRLLPSHVRSFDFTIVSRDSCGGVSCFVIKSHENSSRNGPEIIIEGTTAVELASGLHWYLKYWCGAHISWDKTGGTQVASVPVPGSLPRVKDGGVVIQRPIPWNYYQNVVTSSYSYVWWDWKRWEKEIDWMALQGINLPLAFTGQESIWQKVFMDLNITAKELDNFFGGPAFLAWARMGNLHGWGGPLSQNWLDQQLNLQKQILARMLELGMTPVLPSFSGNVPAALKRIYPSAQISRLGDWNTVDGNKTWCCTYLLDPSDPLFIAIGEAFILKQIEDYLLLHILADMLITEYGNVTDIYNCDTFNENIPPTDNVTYISSVGAAVYKAMSKGNKHAVWLMQGWLFYDKSSFWKRPQMQALLHSVPLGKMIVLDLFADVKPIWKTSSQFYGTPYIWCLLHNFGGNIEMYGILDSISSRPIEARTSENSSMVGVGMCMEGIEQNPIVYELMSEMSFRSESVNALEWTKTYSRRRYGKAVDEIEAAWNILYQTIYNCTDGIAGHNHDFIVKFPQWDPSASILLDTEKQVEMQMPLLLPQNRRFLSQEKISDLPKPHLWYSPEDVIEALRLFIDAGSKLSGSLTYRYDLIDLTRQVLSKHANQLFLDALAAYQRQDARNLDIHSQKFVQLIKDIDELLASDNNFLLGTWLESAKSLASNPTDRRQYEWNARTQVTMWYDNTELLQSKLHDYANKFWSGLLKDYYLPRASTYFYYLSRSLKENAEFKLEEWEREWISYSNTWQAGTELYPVKTQGEALDIARALYNKYFN
ncbi:hypothetical protein SAY86_010585 [Trapa natans]|uniref:Alpha-N-acetylglucosaminidase n=1 Tax=Trapa natans TaxID=22666 RepID=A0AAN7R1Z8_TRANT|nr:hypothetical protein SAY86_010585 [Trapa natans]